MNFGRSCFHQVSYANHLSFPSNWNILDFYDFLIASRPFILFLWKHNSFMSIYVFKRKKLRRNVAFSTTAIRIILLHLRLSANYVPFSKFGWRQKHGLSQIHWLSFSFSHAWLLGHPVYFDDQDFLRFSSDFSFLLFNAGKLWEML